MNEHKDIYKIVSKNIKKYRKLRNYTQQELADKCFMTREYIGRIESDKGIKRFFIRYNIYQFKRTRYSNNLFLSTR